MPNLLSFTILFPLIGALAVAGTPASYRFLIRIIAIVTTALSLACGIAVFASFDPNVAGYQFKEALTWVEAIGIQYKVGVDGINVGLVLMGTIVAFAATAMSYLVVERVKEFYLLLLVMIGGILGAFASLDIFFFFFFHELALIPTFIMIGVWGRGANKNYATFNITLYLSAGALITLLGLVALYLTGNPRTFDIEELTRQFSQNAMPLARQQLIFPLLLFGFGILVSLWPFHTWAPLGYGAAPTPTAMLHAGVLKKFGLYGLLRIALPLMPQASQSWVQVIAYLCLGNIIYNGFVAMRQRDLNQLIGNSSVAHMGFIFLGLASLSLVGVTGAVMIMVAHGLLAALSFAISGYFYKEAGTLDMDKMGGFLQRMPFVGSAFLIAAMAGCGLPGFANFVGEAMTLFAAYQSLPLITSFAVWGGLVIAAIYMLRAVRDILHGPLPAEFDRMSDALGWWRKLPFALLFLALLFFGVWPRTLTEKIQPAAQRILEMATAKQPAPTSTAATVAQISSTAPLERTE
ncbi:MAG TPA: NADH-quinone oxidoreductase subunit M [Verrucomicrobiae bacterium]